MANLSRCKLFPPRLILATSLFFALGVTASLELTAEAQSTAAPTKLETSMSLKSWLTFKKPDKSDLKKTLSPVQFDVTQNEGTERPFKNEYWDNKREGIYVDIVSGEPLFSSKDKFDSGTGWPSFSRPIGEGTVTTRRDRKLFTVRTEVRSKIADSHLGHVFEDGPPPTGLRYCMNSASLRFVARENLEIEGYGEYLKLFAPNPEQDTKANQSKKQTERAIIAGGCFWGMEELVRKQPGVLQTRVGYTGGSVKNPNYELVKTGASGHAEALEVEFDSQKTSYEEILRFFFRIHDPTTSNRQGNDVGTQYRSAIFYLNEGQRAAAEKILIETQKGGRWKKPIVTEITKAGEFYVAEDYHQDYLQKHPDGYTCHFIRD